MFSFTKVSTAAVIVALASSAVAVPYASYIRVEETNLIPGMGTNITYNLNEPADSVSIELLDESNAVVGSFAGTTDRGPNSVAWDGTINNDGGAQLPADTYRVRITADKNNAPWAEIASNRSTALLGPGPTIYNSIYDGFGPNEFLFIKDTDSDFFGKAYSSSSSRTSGHTSGVVTVFRSDLEVFDETDGYASSILHGPELDTTAVSDAALLSATFDPRDTTKIFFVGHLTHRFWRGDLNDDAILHDADPFEFHDAGWWPRSMVIRYEGETRMCYFATTIGMFRVSLDEDGNMTGPMEQIAVLARDRAPLRIDVDSDNNLYFVVKQTISGTHGMNGILLRWDADTVDAATAAAPLTEATASWKVTYDNDVVRNMLGLAISPAGDIYTVFSHGTTSFLYENGIYYVGNAATPTLTKTLGASDKIVDLRDINGTTWAMNTISSGIRCDPAGNIVLFDRLHQQIRMWTPGGPSSHAVIAPPSQTITMGTGVADWGMY